MADSTRRPVVLSNPPPPPAPRSGERRPLLGTLYSEDQIAHDVDANPYSQLPVYTNIHRIRRDIVKVVEDYLSLEQLRDVRINVSVIRPLVDKFYELEDISIIYCLLVNRAQFLFEESLTKSQHNVNWTRATLCELIATRVLRRFGEDHEGTDGLLLLARILVAGFEPFQGAPVRTRQQAQAKTSWTFNRTLPALEVAILTESKHFLGSSTCHNVVSAIYDGRIIYTPSTYWDIIPDHYKLQPIALYDPRESPLLNQYRLIVPRNRNILEQMHFATLVILYVGVMLMREKSKFTALEVAFAVFAFGWGLDQFATMLAHGWSVYTQNLWSFLDITFVSIYFVYLVLRLHGFRLGDVRTGEHAFGVLALAAPVLVPRVAFSLLSDNLVLLCLRAMIADFFFLTALSAWCFLGFLLALLWLGQGSHPVLTISKWMIYIWFGLDGTGIQRSTEFHWLLGPILMVAFAFLGNTLFLTILVSMLSNTFSNISANAATEIQYRKAVLTLEGVKADAVFAYQPPFNLVAVFFLLPLKFIVNPRWFHKIHVFLVRLVNLPLLLIIAVAERRLLRPSHGTVRQIISPLAIKWFWQKWQLSALRYMRAVFQVPPPENTHGDIAADDHMTHHMIRRQLTRSTTAEALVPQVRKATRRDSMFPHKMRGSTSEEESSAGPAMARMQRLEMAVQRMELLLSKLVSVEDEAIEDGSEDGINGTRGITTEASYARQGN